MNNEFFCHVDNNTLFILPNIDSYTSRAQALETESCYTREFKENTEVDKVK